MKQTNQITEQMTAIGEVSFAKLKELGILPYPKYYHDTFMDELIRTGDASLIDLSKKYSHLFNIGDDEEHINGVSFELAKTSLEEFTKSNLKLKTISDQNLIDISTENEKVQTQDVIASFNAFQKEILIALKSSDETIMRLKLEIEKLEEKSHIDPLTKAYKCRVLSKDLQEILHAIYNKNPDMHIVLFDADDFKNINDSYGHIAGDKTLIFLSKLLQGSVRKGTRIYRYGGEKFIIVSNRSTLEETTQIASRIIKEISESKLLYKGHNIHLTLSAGIASCKNSDTPLDIIDRANKALHQAKASGKNCYKVNN
jgi:diguanylate cyclase (GGDEF)-like protein